METSIQKTEGLIAAPLTPFDKNGCLNLAAVPAYVDWLSDNKLTGAFVCGTTGEGPSMTTDERIRVAEAWSSAAIGKLRLIVHVGHNSLTDARLLAQHAQSIGAGAIGCMPPQFFQPRNLDEVADCCAEVAAAAPEIPFYYYHIPSMSRVNIKVADLLPLVEQRIPSFAGVKFTYEDLDDYQQCLDYDNQRYDVLFGRDEILLSAIRVGAKGAVGSTYNFAAPIYHTLISAYRKDDLATAESLQKKAVSMIETCINGSWHPIAAFKQLMEFVGVDCGPTRLPIPPLSQQEVESLRSLTEEFLSPALLHMSQQ